MFSNIPMFTINLWKHREMPMKQDPYDLAVIIENLITAHITENLDSHTPTVRQNAVIEGKIAFRQLVKALENIIEKEVA